MALPFLKKEFNFNLSNELIEKLIEVFKNARCANCYFLETNQVHKYQWPDVVLTDRKHELFINDKFGGYHFNFQEITEGQVFVYYDIIKLEAEKYIESNPELELKQNEVFESITALVLVHEFVHWIMDGIIGFYPFEYNSQDTINFHEGFAEFFTWYIVKEYKDHDLVKIFEWLYPTEKDSQYLRYGELIRIFGSQSDDRNNPKIDIEKVLDIINICKTQNLQKFNDLMIKFLKEEPNSSLYKYCVYYLKQNAKELDHFYFKEIFDKLPQEITIKYKNLLLINKFKYH